MRAELVKTIMAALPLDQVQGRQEISTMLEGLAGGAGGLGVVTALTLFYSGSGAIGAVRQAVESTQPAGVPGRRFPRSKLFDILVTMVTMPVLLLVTGIALSRELATVVDREPVLRFLAALHGGGLLYFVGAVLLFGWLYWVVNPGERRWRDSLGGAAFAAGLLTLSWFGLKLWFGLSGGGSAVYGAMTAFIGLLLFLHLAAIAVVLGAHLAESLRRYRSARPDME